MSRETFEHVHQWRHLGSMARLADSRVAAFRVEDRCQSCKVGGYCVDHFSVSYTYLFRFEHKCPACGFSFDINALHF